MKLNKLSFEQSEAFYKNEFARAANDNDVRYLATNDLYFLLSRLLNRSDVRKPWLYARIREFEASPDGFLDLWAREHYKSTIITFAGSIQEILKDPEITIGIFSHTRVIATNFVRQIKNEFENNGLLQHLFPFIVPPKGSESRAWGESMLCVKRETNPKEQTVEAWGVVKGQPTSKHFKLRVYDDIVTVDSVTNAEMIEKTTDMFALSDNLGAHGGRARAIGTRYHHGDSYKTIMERKVFVPRVYAATDDGTVSGKPVFLSQDELDRKRRTMGAYIFSCQMLQSPSPDEGAIFQRKWFKHYDVLPARLDRQLISADLSFKDKKGSDFVVFQVWGQLGSLAYLIDQWRGVWAFTETVAQFRALCKRYPQAYEKLVEDKANGPAVIDTLKLEIPGIIPVEPFGSKEARAHAVTPFFEAGNVLFPKEGSAPWLDGYLIELSQFPVVAHDDQVDATTQALHRMFHKQPLRINPDILKPKGMRR